MKNNKQQKSRKGINNKQDGGQQQPLGTRQEQMHQREEDRIGSQAKHCSSVLAMIKLATTPKSINHPQ